MTTRHPYYTRSNKSKIMAEYEADNVAVRESLAQVQGEMNLFRGNMETILEILQSQRNLASVAANVTRAAGVTIPDAAASTTVDTPTETVVPNSGNRQMTGAPQAPNAQLGMQHLQPANVAQTVPPSFSYPPQMWFTSNMPAPIAPEASRPASQVVPPAVDPARPADYQLLDDRIRVIEGFSSFGIDARDLCLVPNVVLPQKFKVPNLPKYKGLSCPRSHLTIYCRKMASHIDNDNLLIHCFQDSLVGASLDWYMSLERSKIRSWRDLSEAFLKQYKYNLDMAPTRLQLQSQSQRSNETFKEYAQCWHEMASRVRPTLSNNELVDIFMGTLQGLYFEKMIGSSSTNFTDMVTIGERVESELKSGKIIDTTTHQTTNKRPHGGFAKKKEGEENVVMVKARPRYQFPMAPMPYYPYSYITAAQ
ncbi:uncharacterized protein LOC127079504 [Lathyrus oleraceus]|uniref:uncharacterized protein LOC127079504 n=1 Tax=Pisum sativum TaxID=3888 RepID=UPI0021D28A58|nr:uncharacterized protein LOC127079504 [Pisum sativum]